MTGHTDAINSVAFGPDGHLIASASDDGTMRVWDADTGKSIGSPLTPLPNQRGSVSGVAFSPDGKRIATNSEDSTVRFWDAVTHRPLGDPLMGTSAPRPIYSGPTAAMTFSHDGRQIASGNADQTVQLWPAYLDSTSALCAKLTTNMSRQQWRDWVSPDIDYIKVCPGLPVAPDAPAH